MSRRGQANIASDTEADDDGVSELLEHTAVHPLPFDASIQRPRRVHLPDVEPVGPSRHASQVPHLPPIASSPAGALPPIKHSSLKRRQPNELKESSNSNEHMPTAAPLDSPSAKAGWGVEWDVNRGTSEAPHQVSPAPNAIALDDDGGQGDAEVSTDDGSSVDLASSTRPLEYEEPTAQRAEVSTRGSKDEPSMRRKRSLATKSVREVITKTAEDIPGHEVERDIAHVDPRLGAVTRAIDKSRQVKLWSGKDVQAFDTMSKWKAENPNKSLADAMKNFCGVLPAADAIAKILYNINKFDYILKFKRTKHDSAAAGAREAFEAKLLQYGLILELEEHSKEPGSAFVKLIVPFAVLCREAHFSKLRFPLKEATQPLSADALPQKPTGIFHHFQYYFDMNTVQTAVFNETRLDDFVFKVKDASGKVVLATAADHPLHLVHNQFFQDRHRLLLAHNMVTQAEIRIKGIAGKSENRNEGILFLLKKKIYTDAYTPHQETNYHFGDEKGEGKKPAVQSVRDLAMDEKAKMRKVFPEEAMQPPQEPDYVNITDMTLRARLIYESLHGGFFARAPADMMRDYFGEKVALYFVYLDFYNSWLLISTVIGLIVFLYGGIAMLAEQKAWSSNWNMLFDNDLTPFFGLAMALWSVMYLEYWKRRNSYYAHLWGVDHLEEAHEKRDEFQARGTKRSPVTGKLELYFPQRVRRWRQFISLLVMIPFIGMVAATVVAQIAFEEFVSTLGWNEQATALAVSGVGLLSIQLCRRLFMPVSELLNEWENYRTTVANDKALVIKQWTFEFINIYSHIIYFAFIKNFIGAVNITGLANEEEHMCDKDICSSDMTLEFFVIFIGDQLVDRIEEFWIPYLVDSCRAGKHRKSLADEKNKQPQHYKDETKNELEGMDDDFFQKAVQYGYVTMFVTAFPIAPLFALVNNFFEEKSDSYKFLEVLRRPPPVPAQDIGIWEDVLQLCSFIAVTSNGLLVAFSSVAFYERYLKPNDPTQWIAIRLAFLMFWHLGVYGIWFIVAWMIPDKPKIVKISQEREQYLEEVAIDPNAEVADETLETDGRGHMSSLVDISALESEVADAISPSLLIEYWATPHRDAVLHLVCPGVVGAPRHLYLHAADIGSIAGGPRRPRDRRPADSLPVHPVRPVVPSSPSPPGMLSVKGFSTATLRIVLDSPSGPASHPHPGTDGNGNRIELPDLALFQGGSSAASSSSICNSPSLQVSPPPLTPTSTHQTSSRPIPVLSYPHQSPHQQQQQLSSIAPLSPMLRSYVSTSSLNNQQSVSDSPSLRASPSTSPVVLVTGRVILTLPKQLSHAQELSITITGKLSVHVASVMHWVNPDVGGVQPVTRTLVDRTVVLWSRSADDPSDLAAGEHEWSFALPVPAYLPPSVELNHGKVEYALRARMARRSTILPDIMSPAAMSPALRIVRTRPRPSAKVGAGSSVPSSASSSLTTLVNGSPGSVPVPPSYPLPGFKEVVLKDANNYYRVKVVMPEVVFMEETSVKITLEVGALSRDIIGCIAGVKVFFKEKRSYSCGIPNQATMFKEESPLGKGVKHRIDDTLAEQQRVTAMSSLQLHAEMNFPLASLSNALPTPTRLSLIVPISNDANPSFGHTDLRVSHRLVIRLDMDTNVWGADPHILFNVPVIIASAASKVRRGSFMDSLPSPLLKSDDGPPPMPSPFRCDMLKGADGYQKAETPSALMSMLGSGRRRSSANTAVSSEATVVDRPLPLAPPPVTLQRREPAMSGRAAFDVRQIQMMVTAATAGYTAEASFLNDERFPVDGDISRSLVPSLDGEAILGGEGTFTDPVVDDIKASLQPQGDLRELQRQLKEEAENEALARTGTTGGRSLTGSSGARVLDLMIASATEAMGEPATERWDVPVPSVKTEVGVNLLSAKRSLSFEGPPTPPKDDEEANSGADGIVPTAGWTRKGPLKRTPSRTQQIFSKTTFPLTLNTTPELPTPPASTKLVSAPIIPHTSTTPLTPQPHVFHFPTTSPSSSNSPATPAALLLIRGGGGSNGPRRSTDANRPYHSAAVLHPQASQSSSILSSVTNKASSSFDFLRGRQARVPHSPTRADDAAGALSAPPGGPQGGVIRIPSPRPSFEFRRPSTASAAGIVMSRGGSSGGHDSRQSGRVPSPLLPPSPRSPSAGGRRSADGRKSANGDGGRRSVEGRRSADGRGSVDGRRSGEEVPPMPTFTKGWGWRKREVEVAPDEVTEGSKLGGDEREDEEDEDEDEEEPAGGWMLVDGVYEFTD
ncbi:Anoctamin-7 [Irineochytrium annulatum]|nr:Anoctamin-7 [Irineochytrium annulatum]